MDSEWIIERRVDTSRELQKLVKAAEWIGLNYTVTVRFEPIGMHSSGYPIGVRRYTMHIYRDTPAPTETEE